MPFSTSVVLSRDVEPAWPDVCVVCEGPAHGATARVLRSPPVGVFSLLVPVLGLFGWARVPVPVCEEGCRGRLRRQAWGRRLLLLGSAVLGFVLAERWGLVGDGGVRGPAVVLGSVFLAVGYGVVRPRWIELGTCRAGHEYEFASPEVAAGFREANREWVVPSWRND